MNELSLSMIIIFNGISLICTNAVMLYILKAINKQQSYIDLRVGVLYKLIVERIDKLDKELKNNK